ETEDGQIVILNSGGETLQIVLTGDDPSVQEGDLIVTKITAPNSNYENEKVTYQTNNTVVVNEEDRDLFPVEETDTDTTQNTLPLQDVQANKIYKINAPKTSAPPSYFLNVYDVDNSFVDVELDGNF
ncbi:MAG: hypothetical protein RLY43_847, partial [Bacteroidota bacterium]